MSGITIQPMVTTGIANGFNVSSDGFVQGFFLDDPAVRYQLEGAAVDASQATPLWGGLPVTLKVPAAGAGAMGPTMIAAAGASGINAWTCFQQSSNGIISPGSNVPLYSAGMSLNFMRVGSNARMVLPLKLADVSGLVGQAPNTSIYWDPTNLYLTVTSTSNYAVTGQIEFLSTTSKTVSYSAGSANWVTTGAVAVVRI